tara:strand:- start:10471 stop:11163 length:693 start_codon:yes stop_codon:yes gene_type:complete
MDYLPKIEVDLMQEEPEALIEEAEDSEEESGGPNFVYDDDTSLPEVKEKVMLDEQDIFVDKKTKAPMQIKAVIEDIAPVPSVPVPSVPTPVKPVKKKRVMSEAQLERLKKGREKALANRRAKANENKEVKDLKEKKKKKDIQKLREEVNEEKPTRAKSVTSLEDIPSELLVHLQEKAIEGYDTKRKARKQKKKEEENLRSSNTVHRHMVQNALKPATPQYGEAGFWNDCF